MAETNSGNSVFAGKDSQHDKEKVMRTGRKNSFFYSVSDTFKFLAAVTLAAGMGVIGAALKELPKGAGFSGAMSTIAGSEVGMIFLGAAALATAVAVGSQYVSSRYFQAANFDALEVNAKHTAKYLSKELQKDSLCLAEEQKVARSDGKTWQEYLGSRSQQPPSQQIH